MWNKDFENDIMGSFEGGFSKIHPIHFVTIASEVIGRLAYPQFGGSEGVINYDLETLPKGEAGAMKSRTETTQKTMDEQEQRKSIKTSNESEDENN
ncbi:MAG: hypothetical protein U5L96_17205 [Owenweeksia sp.]|nr:hypothetical protein [Owenweeksia sp.]